MQQQRRRPPVALSPVALNNHSSRPIRQTSRSVPAAVSPCFGCSQPMHNQFLSNVLDHLWHPECVRCFICRCVLNEQCYSREGKLYCKDDFIKKYIHRCFACQNLVQSQEFIRRIRPGRIYHADCFVCSQCKRTLQDDDISALLKSDGEALNDLDCICQTCLHPDKSSNETTSVPNEDENKMKDNTTASAINGKPSPSTATPEEKPLINGTSVVVDNHVNEQQSMEVDEPPPAAKPSISPVKEYSSPPSPPTTTPPPPPPKTTGRQSKVRQSTSSNGSKRSSAKTKTTPVSRQKQTPANARKGRSPATRSRSSAGTSATPPIVQTRSSNRRTTKSTRYRKRSFSSGSDEEETEDDDDDDTDFTEEENMPDTEHEMVRSPAVKNKPSTNSNEKKPEPESTPVISQAPPPPQTSTNPSLLSQAKMSEPLSLLSGLAANPMSISSIMKPDITPSFMPPNFNPAFPTHPQFLPPGFPLQPRLPMPPPPPSLITPQTQSVPASDPNRSSRSADASDSDSLDRSSSPSQMDVSTSVEPGTPARPITPPKGARKTSSSSKPSALSSLLEFGTLPPSSLGDIRPTSTSTNPFPFPFVTPGPGVPFSPQAAAGMATFYRPPFGISPSAMPLDMTQSNSNLSKQKSDMTDNNEIISQNLLDDSSTSSSTPKKKARKSNARSKAKAKKSEIDGENGIDEDKTSPPPPPPPPPTNKKKRKAKANTTENGTTNDSDETKITNGNANNHSHNLLAQMGLINNSFMPPPSASSINGQPPTPNSQQAQLAAMYNMAPHFAAYNAFQGAFNPAFAAAAYASGYPTPYGFHSAFGAPTSGQPFPFMTPTPAMNNTSAADDKASSIIVPETRPAKSRSKSNTGGEKKKPTTPRSNKKKSVVPPTLTDFPVPAEAEPVVSTPSIEPTPAVATTPESTSTPTKRQMSGTESDDFDDHQQSQATNGKSGNESDGSMGDGDRSLNTVPSTSSSSAALEKKGARTTIKPQQLDALCKAYDTCSKPNKTQREQLVADTGLGLRVIQVWFQNKRSKERKGKTPKDKETPLDDDDAGDDSQPSTPPTTSESVPVNNTET